MSSRAAFNKGLDQVCDIYRKTVTVNASHEKVGSLALFAEDVPCFMSMPTGRKVILPSGIDPSKLRLVYFRHDQDVKEMDQIEFGDRRYVVNSVNVTPKDHHKEAMCETAEGG